MPNSISWYRQLAHR